ncbi:MAG: amidohydrolase [Acidobacteria bacterium]|nr:MAG: amidohydrolase [Acidobacteriota bacterium]
MRDPIFQNHPSRRQFLKVLAAAGACAMAPAGELLAQRGQYKVTAKGGSIDVHHHHAPPGFTLGGGRGGGRAQWTPQLSVEQMDKFGIGTAILSLTQMGDIIYDNTEKGRAAVRTVNEFGAKCMRDFPKRFGLFASIPFPDVEGSLKEIAYAYDTLKCDGISIYTNDNQGHWPGDPHLEPIWEELGRRKAILYMHPWVPACCNNLNYGASSFMNEIDFETTRAVTSFITNGVLFRHPDLKLITAHSGGTLPVLAGRMKDRYPADKKQYIPNGLLAEIQKLYYDCAHATYKMPWLALTSLVHPTQYLFGTDYSPEPIETTINEIPRLGLSRELLEMLERKNAERLFPRFKV